MMPGRASNSVKPRRGMSAGRSDRRSGSIEMIGERIVDIVRRLRVAPVGAMAPSAPNPSGTTVAVRWYL
jgi:hypothetical protein